MTTTATTTAPMLRVLARREIRHYLGAKLYWFGTALLVAVTVAGFVGSATRGAADHQPSAAMDMIAPAALLGVLGLIVMAGLTRRSDRAAAAAGTVAVPERTRTAALAAATVVPVATAVLWYAAAVVTYLVYPPTPDTVPFPPFGDGYVLTVMFALGVVPALGGPILGLLLARWLPRRGVTPLAVVLVVLVTIILQGNFEATWRWRVAWPWTYWYGPFGWNSGTGHWLALPGSPHLWVAYLLALCALGVLVAIYHDPESDRARLRLLIGATAGVAAVALVLTMLLGLPEATWNPITGPIS
ncbi:hypothetical protein ABZS66_31665 [Dactylosporangium sp. NPDC005572]|uniref:hypothetical protein n=1 Tax=Dactylosporangium sp. NPDC005572 TaxID=3156889 RepID=UPI0033A596E5